MHFLLHFIVKYYDNEKERNSFNYKSYRNDTNWWEILQLSNIIISTLIIPTNHK